MGEILLKLDCELVYEPRQGVEVYFRHGGSLSDEVTQHLVQAGKELSLALRHLTKMETESMPQKVRTKIEVEEV